MVFDVPKVWEMIQATSEKTVCGFIEFELIKLAERINVSGNLTDAQVQTIAYDLSTCYPNETIADFKICFDRASAGHYGKIFKLDGIEVGIWVRAYLDEKYQIMENQLLKEKDEHHNRVISSMQDTDWLQLWKESIEGPELEKPKSQNMAFLEHLRGMTQNEIERKGQAIPDKDFYPKTSDREVVKKILHVEYIKQNYDARTGDKLTEWIPENEWLKQLEED